MIEFQLEFPSGVIGSCMSMYSANQSHILLMGERGRIELEPATGYSGNRLWVGRGRPPEITPPDGPGKTNWAGQRNPLARCIHDAPGPSRAVRAQPGRTMGLEKREEE